MKLGPVFAMVALLLVAVWMVLQPTLAKRERIDPAAYRYRMELGAQDVFVEQRGRGEGFEYHFVGDRELQARGWVTADEFQAAVNERLASWETRPAFERTMLGFFNITGWANFLWVFVGLGGQAAFFGRMLLQWVVSEKARESVVPEAFWWLSFLGGVCLFAYFVWRVDFVGVLGQSTGVVIYARNIRLIAKQKRRAARAGAAPAPAEAAGVAPPAADNEGVVHAGMA